MHSSQVNRWITANQMFCVVAAVFAFVPLLLFNSSANVISWLAVASGLASLFAAVALRIEPIVGIHLLWMAFGISLALVLAGITSFGLIYLWSCVFIVFAILATPKSEQGSWFRLVFFAPEIVAFSLALLLVVA